jgi:hypothetical protein
LSDFNTLGLTCDVLVITYLDAASPVPARLKNNATQAMAVAGDNLRMNLSRFVVAQAFPRLCAV